MRPEKLFHYTTAERLPEIIASGVIRLATAGVPRHEKPAAWFSSNPEWEHSATKGFMDEAVLEDLRRRYPPGNIGVLPPGAIRSLTLEEQRVRCGLGRIVVPGSAAPVSWTEFKRTSRIRPKVARILERLADEEGSVPSEWWASYAPVRSSRWLAVEIHDGHRWRAFQAADADPATSPFSFFRQPEEHKGPAILIWPGNHG